MNSPNSLPVGVLAVVPSSWDLPKFVVRGCRGAAAEWCPTPASTSDSQVRGVQLLGLQPGPLAWPGPQDGLGQGGLRLKWAKGRFWSKMKKKVEVLGMEFSIVENLSGPQESIFSLSRRPQLHFRKKYK